MNFTVERDKTTFLPSQVQKCDLIYLKPIFQMNIIHKIELMHHWAPLGTAGHICANFATCSWEPLTMLNPQFVAGEHGLFGGHKSEDIRTFFSKFPYT